MNTITCTINCSDVRVGKFAVCGPSTDQSVMPQIRQGKYEPHIQELFCGMVKNGMTVCDIGANFGQHTVLLSRLVGPTGKVYAIEASSINVEYLRQTVKANDCANVIVIERGVWSHETELTFSHVENAEATSFCSNKEDIRHIEQNPACHYQTIAVSPLDTLVLDDIDFIKIDVEGSELFAMQGAQRFTQKGNPILLELNTFTYKTFMGIDVMEMVTYMQERGYCYMYIYNQCQWLLVTDGTLAKMFANGHVLIDVFFSKDSCSSKKFRCQRRIYNPSGDVRGD